MSQLNRSGYRFFDDDRRAGTLAPFLRASLNPIAIACFRLVTVRPDPLLSLPFFRRRIADFTRFDAAFPILRHHVTSARAWVHGAFQQNESELRFSRRRRARL